MKLLNEATLVYFSTCPSQTTKEGWLYKKGEVNKNFQKRWFVLKGNLLFYFDKPADREPNGVIILEGYTVELADAQTDSFTFQILFKGVSSARKYILQAESQHVMELWMKAITCAGYDYMRLMVAELKSQLDDLTALELSNELADCKTSPSSSPFSVESSSEATPVAVHGKVNFDSHTDLNLFSAFETTTSESSKHRKNPFDTDIAKDLSELDPFGQVPFNPIVATSLTTSAQLPLPEVPSRKKNKTSPRLGRKHAPSAKISNKTQSSSVKSSQSHTKFYEDAQQYLAVSALPAVISSRFNQLHLSYGKQIETFIAASKPAKTDVDNTVDVLIQL